MAAEPIPEGYHTVSPYLAVDDAAQAIEFYKKAFGATELVRMEAPGGMIGHAELGIGDSRVLLADPCPQASTKPPMELGATTVSIFMYVEDVDAVVKQAVDAGATVRALVVDRHACRGPHAGGDRRARPGGDGRMSNTAAYGSADQAVAA